MCMYYYRTFCFNTLPKFITTENYCLKTLKNTKMVTYAYIILENYASIRYLKASDTAEMVVLCVHLTSIRYLKS